MNGYPVSEWLLDDEREMPETVPDEECRTHPLMCKCEVCRRPEAEWHRKQAFRARSAGVSPSQLAARRTGHPPLGG